MEGEQRLLFDISKPDEDVNDSPNEIDFTGMEGEHLVCADLLHQIYDANLAGEGRPHDVFVVVDKVVYRIQVKSTRCVIKRKNINRYPLYEFKLTRRNGNTYDRSLVDMIAFVVTSTHEVGYEEKQMK
jgi:hypothetical protein